MSEEKRHLYRSPFIYCVIFTLTFLLLLVRCFLGFDPTDESFYYTIPLRFLKGDCPIIDEWQVSQFYSILLCPFVWIHTHLFGGTDGILLAGRIVYLCIAMSLALAIFFTFRQQLNNFYALICSLLYLFYARGNIMGLSYYKLYTAFCLLSLILYICYSTNTGAKQRAEFRLHQYLILGLLQGLAALCMPFFALWILFAFVFTIPQTRKRKSSITYLFGSIAIFLLFLEFIFAHGYGPVDILTNFQYMLEDPSYHMSIWEKSFRTAGGLFKQCWAGIPFFIYCMWHVLKGRQFPARQTLVLAISSVILTAFLGKGFDTPGALFDQITFFSFPFLFTRDEGCPDLSIGKRIYLYGCACAILFWLGSDTRTNSLCTGFVISAIGSVYMLHALVMNSSSSLPKDITSPTVRQHIYQISFSFLLIFYVCSAGYVRFATVYRDCPVTKLTDRLKCGPAKGLFTTSVKADDYNKQYEGLIQLKEIVPDVSQKIFVSRRGVWIYLAANYSFGTCTAWTMELSNFQQTEYLKSHPQKFPDIVIILHDDVGTSLGWSAEVTPNAYNYRKGYLWEQLMKRGYTKIVYDAFDAYIRTDLLSACAG